jgi:tRNA pseudouridine55 synthase
MTQYDGVILCDKPFGISSHDLVSQIRQAIGQKRVGHTGSLDPRATGLMLVCLGRATKIAQFLSEVDKSYNAEIKLGVRSKTYDGEGIIESDDVEEIPDISVEEMKNILASFKGKIKQKVPAYSAIKVGGERLYKLARMGKEVETPEREIEIKEISLIRFNPPFIGFEATCSKGTYLRALANDIGEKIGCGAYLSRLARTRIGNFELKDALTIGEIKHYREAGILKRYILPIEKVLSFPAIEVTDSFSSSIISGKQPGVKDIANIRGEFAPNDYVSLTDKAGRIMAVACAKKKSTELIEAGGEGFIEYVRVLN